MSKRFTESEKWKDPWFRRLPIVGKMFWVYVCDHCDHAGVISPDWEAMSFYFGTEVTEDVLTHFEKQIQQMGGGKLFIRSFIKFQYGKLSKECKPHNPVFQALKKHGLVAEDVEQNEFHVSRVDSVIRERIIARDGLVCAYTGRTLELWEAEIDHIVPRSKGGSLSPVNLVVCDAVVNSRKSDLSLEEFCELEGWSLTEVKERLRKIISKPIKGFQSLQDKDKDKDKEKDSGVESAERRGQVAYSPEFLAFWAAYPNKTGKGDAWKAWQRIKPRPDIGALIPAVSRDIASPGWRRDHGKYIPHPATWLNGRRWEDEGLALTQTTHDTF